jgi:uncharacterized membrane protein
MKKIRLYTIAIVTRFLPAAVWGAVCAASLAAPLLEMSGRAPAAAAARALFAPVCHQDPIRSFTLFGIPLAVCHRCSGIYLGLFLLSLLPPAWSVRMLVPGRRRILVVAASVPLLMDALLPLAGLWENTPASRFITGLIFGAMLSSLLVTALADIQPSIPWRRTRVDVNVLGGHV